jgi:hypothetical protein
VYAVLLHAMLQELGDELDYPEELQDANTTGCFTRTKLAPEQQWSDIPAAGQQDVKYCHSTAKDSQVSKILPCEPPTFATELR